MKNTTLVLAIVLIIVLCLNIMSFTGCANDDIVIEFVKPTDGETASTLCPPDVEDSKPVPELIVYTDDIVPRDPDEICNPFEFSGDYADESNVWHYPQWVDTERFYSEYVAFLEQSLLDFESDKLDIAHYVKTLRVYTIVGECLICNSDNPYVGMVVYETGYHTLGSYAMGEFDSKTVQNTIGQLKEYEDNLENFPLESF